MKFLLIYCLRDALASIPPYWARTYPYYRKVFVSQTGQPGVVCFGQYLNFTWTLRTYSTYLRRTTLNFAKQSGYWFIFTPVSVPIPTVHSCFLVKLPQSANIKFWGDQILSTPEQVWVFYLTSNSCCDAIILGSKLTFPVFFHNSKSVDKEAVPIGLYFNCWHKTIQPTIYWFIMCPRNGCNTFIFMIFICKSYIKIGLNYNLNSPSSPQRWRDTVYSFHCRIKLMKVIKIELAVQLLRTTFLFSAVSAFPELAGRHK